jgi:hypothetical protein
MLLRLILPLLILSLPTGGLELLYTGVAHSDRFCADHLGNIYFIDGHKIIKVEPQPYKSLEYGSFASGPITAADVSNPFQIMVFYRDFNRVVFLDNKLSRLRSPINLSDMGIEQAVLVCSSVSGGIWIFSDRDNRLVYFDDQLHLTHQSMILGSIAGSLGKPVYMTEAQNQLYLYVPRKGILVFDRFASYLTTIPYSGPERFQVMGGKIIYFSDGELTSLDIESREVRSIDLPEKIKIDDARLQPKRLFLLSGNKFVLYGIR